MAKLIMDINFSVGDIVRVDVKVKEGTKERIQSFEGTVIALRGSGLSQTFTVRKIGAAAVGVERIWPVNSPAIDKITVKRKKDVKRAKLYYMRNLRGKAALEV